MYVTGTSDKKKDMCLKWWLRGAGIMGFEYYYVGLIQKGLVRSIFTVVILIPFLLISLYDIKELYPVFLFALLIWIVFALKNYFKIKMGTFTDNVGNFVRE